MNDIKLTFHSDTSEDIKNKMLLLAEKIKRSLMVTGLMEPDAIKMVEEFYQQAHNEGVKQNNPTNWNIEPTS